MANERKLKVTSRNITKKSNVELAHIPRIKVPSPGGEPYQKVTVCLFDKHVLFLDKVALAIREKTGKRIKRAELVRALVDQAAGMIQPAREDFEKAIRNLFPE